MKKIVLTFGLIAGAMLSAMMVMTIPFMDKIGFDKGEVVGYTSMVLAFLMVYFGVRAYRDNVAGGTIGFGKAFVVGLSITLVATACYVATWQVLYRTVASDFGDKYTAYALDKAKKAGKTEAQLAAQKKEFDDMFELYKNPLVNIALTSIEPLPVGLIFTLVSAGILSRRRQRS
jgi:hypothetical protein